MSKEAMKLALEALENWLEFDPENFGEIDKKAITALREALANEALDKKAENARELGLDYEPAQQEFVSPGGGYVPAIPAQRQALAEQALDKKAENARELGLDYELPITMQEGEFDCTHAERLCAELKAAHPVTSCTHPDLGISSLREDGTAARWGCVMCGTEFVPKATQRWAEFNETTKRNIEHAEWYLSTHPQPAQQGLSDLDVWKARALQAEAVIAKFMAEPAAQQEPATQRAHEMALRQWERWKQYAIELQEKLVKYEGGAPMVLNTSLPQRTWVGLTDEEIEKEWVKMCGSQSWARHKVYARNIEAKLKEKNT